jgi:hypothetical protein
MFDIQIWKAWFISQVDHQRELKHDERGDIVQTVILAALFAAAAIAIAAIIINKFTGKAESIQTG